MLAEEGGGLSGEEDARWIVDPLDGITNYARGLPIFCVSIALEKAGEVVSGVALDLCYVASGRLDGYYEGSVHAWDVAAGALVVEEAGGKVTDYRGGALDLEGREVEASIGLLHPAMIELTRECG